MATNSRAYNRAYYLANRERRKAQALAWYHKNKGERMKTQRKRLSDDSRSADVEERSTTQEKLRAIKSRSLFDFARSVYPKGVMLICDSCGYKQLAGHHEIAVYFQRGWPRHCDKYMRQQRVE